MKQKLIAISGAHSGCGKTTVAENLLRSLGPSWGAIKYSKTAFYTSVKDETFMESHSRKDTFRLYQAGVQGVVWVQSPPENLPESLDMAINMLSHCEGIIIEGNSPIEFLNPDVVIFVFGKDSKRLKPSARVVIKKANIIIYQNEPPDPDLLTPLQNKKETVETINIDIFERKEYKKLTEVIMKRLDEMDAKQHATEGTDNKASDIAQRSPINDVNTLKGKLTKYARDKKIPCALARRIAEEEGLPYHEIGRIANKFKIKIINCELGCF